MVMGKQRSIEADIRNVAFNNLQQLSKSSLSECTGFSSIKRILVAIHGNDAICTQIPPLSSNVNIGIRFLAKDWIGFLKLE